MPAPAKIAGVTFYLAVFTLAAYITFNVTWPAVFGLAVCIYGLPSLYETLRPERWISAARLTKTR